MIGNLYLTLNPTRENREKSFQILLKSSGVLGLICIRWRTSPLITNYWNLNAVSIFAVCGAVSLLSAGFASLAIWIRNDNIQAGELEAATNSHL